MTRHKILCAAAGCVALLGSSQAWPFAREFNQDNSVNMFHATSPAQLCLFVRNREGFLMIQPHCMVSTSSHSAAIPHSGKSDKK